MHPHNFGNIHFVEYAIALEYNKWDIMFFFMKEDVIYNHWKVFNATLFILLLLLLF